MDSAMMTAAKEGVRAVTAAFTSPDDDYEPMGFFEIEGGERKILGLGSFFENDTKKELLAEAILPALVQSSGATSVLLLTSCWMLSLEPGDGAEYMADPDHLMPRDHPDRVEIVLLTEVGKDGIENVQAAYINRDPRGDAPPTLSEFNSDFMVAGVSIESRFTDPLIPILKERN